MLLPCEDYGMVGRGGDDDKNEIVDFLVLPMIFGAPR